jgi:DNA-binding transcriptional LysR family regulator
MMMIVAGLYDLDLRHLVALRTVATEGTFGRAAATLGFSQAAISQQIAALERAVGVPVFDRPGGPRPVRLTPAGRILLRHADAILDRVGHATQELARLRAGDAGRLAVGTFQSVAVRLLPDLIARLKADSPDLEISVAQIDQTDELLAALRDGALDVAFVETALEAPDLEIDLVMRDPYVVLLSVGDPALAALPAGAPFPVVDLAGRPMVSENSCDAVRQVEATLGLQGILPHYVFRTDDISTLQAMVRAGMGAAIMPLLAVDQSDPGIVIRTLDPPLPMRDILVARRRGVHSTAAAERLAKLAVEAGGGAEMRPPQADPLPAQPGPPGTVTDRADQRLRTRSWSPERGAGRTVVG